MARKTSFFNEVYRELDSTRIGNEKCRRVPGSDSERYDYTEIGCDGDNTIIIKAATKDRLKMAEKVAKYFDIKYEFKEELWRRNPDERFIIKIWIPENR